MNPTIIAALYGLIGVCVGGIVTALVTLATLNQQAKQHLEQLEAQARLLREQLSEQAKQQNKQLEAQARLQREQLDTQLQLVEKAQQEKRLAEIKDTVVNYIEKLCSSDPHTMKEVEEWRNRGRKLVQIATRTYLENTWQLNEQEKDRLLGEIMTLLDARFLPSDLIKSSQL